MSAGQLFTALAFVVAGFVQLTIDDGLTRIPDYGKQNSFMVILLFVSVWILFINYLLYLGTGQVENSKYLKKTESGEKKIKI